jgi:hypothetical protein
MISAQKLMSKCHPGGVIEFRFQGESAAFETFSYFQEMRRYAALAGPLNKVIFDLTAVDPVVNIAGRVWDFAQDVFKKKKFNVEFRATKLIYDALGMNPATSSKKTGNQRRNGRTLEVTSLSADVATSVKKNLPIKDESASGILLRCVGKIREIDHGNVIVSLFMEEGEVTAVTELQLFPKMDIKAGATFDYEVSTDGNGETRIKISPVPRVELSIDEKIDLWSEVELELPHESQSL